VGDHNQEECRSRSASLSLTPSLGATWQQHSKLEMNANLRKGHDFFGQIHVSTIHIHTYYI